VASDMSAAGPDVCRVRLAMSRLPGEPLDRFLHDYRQRLDAEFVQITDGQQAMAEQLRQAAEACVFAQALVQQLAPTMDRISSLSYHRDVNAHNILIDVRGQTDGQQVEPQYGLVDFGLAVDAAKWRGGPDADARGQGDWQHLDVGGDCRYWPASAWLQFEVGCYELAEYTALCLEYQSHLDLQGMGITALQVLAELLPPAPDTMCVDGHPLLELWKLRLAWEQYWEAATSYWSALLDTFRNQGDWNALKTKFIEIGVHDVISRSLHAVRVALRDLEETSKQAPPGSSLHSSQALFAVLLVLISSGEDRQSTTSWSAVLAVLTPTRPGVQVVPVMAQSDELEQADCSLPPPSLPAQSPTLSTKTDTPPQRSSTPSSPARQQLRSPGRGSPEAAHPAEKVWLPAPTQATDMLGSWTGLRPSAPISPTAVFASPRSPVAERPTADVLSDDPRPPVAEWPVADVPADVGDGNIESHELFLRLSNLANKVVLLAKAMEKLELRDRDLSAAAAGRISSSLGRGLTSGAAEVMVAGG